MPSTAKSLTSDELETEEKLAWTEPVAAKNLSVSERTMFNMRQAGEIPFFRMRSRIMYSPAALQKWIESQELGPKK